ncbi:hypothetical protein P5F75_08720 [Caldifermentibacillus hisashii]|uniref:hypothetical protein n=1 Tax=Caldifermentibacillus hisashii TaxID=996558 RepID=UPI002E2128F8|nr:hypothetical protein [Caldibacillus thermoamylovorans]MED3643475.1 hypothetical protein [Caldifermentibacillus hisashii]
MKQKLWDVIKLISERKEFGEKEMALAYETLDPDVLSVLQDHFKKGLSMRSEKWL